MPSQADPPTRGELLRAQRPNQIWVLDFQFEETANRQRLKLLEHRRRAHREGRPCVGPSCDADTVVRPRARRRRAGRPKHLRMDKGPELVAWRCDWCRLAGTTRTYIQPGSPWENPLVEGFNGRVRDDLLNTDEFATLLEAQVLAEAWRIQDNTGSTRLSREQPFGCAAAGAGSAR